MRSSSHKTHGDGPALKRRTASLPLPISLPDSIFETTLLFTSSKGKDGASSNYCITNVLQDTIWKLWILMIWGKDDGGVQAL